MKKSIIALNGSILLLALVFGPTSIGLAEEQMKHDGMSSDAVSLASIKAHPTEGQNGVIELNNEICPVGGDKVSGKDSFIHDGVRYQICCSMCVSKFNKNLGKYAYSLAEVKEYMANQKP